MATNQPIIEPVNELAQFDDVATQIMNKFDLLIKQLIARRDALLWKLKDMKEEYLSKESTRKAAMEELANTQRHMEELTHETAGYSHKTPAALLSSTMLSQLQTQIAEFGEMKKWELDYSLKKEPILAVGKVGEGNNELNAIGLSLDEPNQLIYIADYFNSRIQDVSFDGKFLKRFGEDILKGPWGISVTDDNVFITDKDLHALLQFNKKDYKLVKRTGNKGAGEGELNKPQGLCVDYHGDVYVADLNNHRISIFSKALEFVNCLGTQQLQYTQDVKVTPTSIVVLDQSPNCVHFYSRSGHLINSCITIGEDGVVHYPFFFSLDVAGNILITDFSRHNVKILSPSGVLIHTIGREGHGRGSFLNPYGISISALGTIYVISESSNFCLQAF
ncbi:Serine/threonine-protein kinase PknD [Oopsacas minuta]|uniref:Serine/threonine-protein kinase PknD n=1 Tax=Oopsacas minuta TaxID=111878 RepID=A0AAV7KG00_9METZ|nr:Serine/threonine-protein kinase PknD [Oopsacas minuta]